MQNTVNDLKSTTKAQLKNALLPTFEQYYNEKYLSDDPEGKVTVKKMERLVESLPDPEKQLLTERYLSKNSQYLSDSHVYNTVMKISYPTYVEIEKRALRKIAIGFGMHEMRGNA